MEGLAFPNLPDLLAGSLSSVPRSQPPLVNLILSQIPIYPMRVQLEQRQVKARLRSQQRSDIVKEADALKPTLPKAKQMAMEQASEKGASSWLTAIPLARYGFNLHKQAFRDALCLRFGWSPARLASHCPCGQPFSVSHALSCPKGAMPSIRHNAIRDITAQLLTKVCPNVGVEPQLQPLSGERFPLRSTNLKENARLNIRAQNFWDKSKRTTFFDVRVFNSHATSNCSSSSDACYRRHEREKRRSYEQRILYEQRRRRRSYEQWKWSMGLSPPPPGPILQWWVGPFSHSGL